VSQPPDRADAVLPRGERVVLRRPVEADAEEYLRLVRESEALHRPWVHLLGTRQAFLSYVAGSRGERELGCLVCRAAGGAIAGAANLTEIVRGVFQSAYLSFYGRAGCEGRGLVREGVGLLLRHAFTEMGLHRVEANVQPGNTRSLALVDALGFRHEGFSPRYLKIGGEWRDHERWAILADEWQERRPG
jgi:ribosomal-protein-alanine N-acetyltransferase